jgi:hypothetical protein
MRSRLNLISRLSWSRRCSERRQSHRRSRPPPHRLKRTERGQKRATHHRTHKMMSSHKNYRYSRAQMDRSRPGGEPISRKPAA